jgi:ribosome biogenesis GTPase
MSSGRVLRSYSNVFYVEVDGEVLECRPRGRLRYRAEKVLAGDLVTVSQAGPGLGAIEEILPRRNELRRPQVANVDQVVLVFSFQEPRLDLALVDRFLVLIADTELPAVFCINKLDLAAAGEAEEVRRVYEGLVDTFLTTSAVTGENLGSLRGLLSGRLSVLAGPSGVGKSSLLNALDPGLCLRTSQVSRKARRGTHTTRHVALLPTGGGGLVADTPGFTHLELEGIAPADLSWFYPEIIPLTAGCRFSGCLHRAEPDCRVKEAAARGEIDPGRYERYLGLLGEVEKTYRAW